MAGKWVECIVAGPAPEALISIFADHPPPTFETPPLKRRKVSQHESASAAYPASVMSLEPPPRAVTLAQVDLCLSFTGEYAPDDSLSSPSSASSLSADLPTFDEACTAAVNLQDLIKVTRRAFRFHLILPGKKRSIEVDVEVPSSRSELEDFRRAAQLSEGSTINGRFKSDSNIVWSQTTITPAHNTFRLFRLQSKILWRDSGVALDRISPDLQELLSAQFPQGSSSASEPWSPRDFYDNVHVPARDFDLPVPVPDSFFECELYPFQRRAVRWLLQREGVQIDPFGRIQAFQRGQNELPESYHEELDAYGNPCFVSHLLGTVVSDIRSAQNPAAEVRGGILSEEMGLGKTVEMIALICLNRRQSHPEEEVDAQSSTNLRRSNSTLIITPPSILEQWKDELKTHAPHLSVFHYQGLRSQRKSSERELISELRSHEVVLTTYNVIASEIHYSVEIPDRNLRHRKQYHQRRSPLIQIDWWRVCLDEAQMVESGVSNAAKVARLVPRRNAWAVSGTPLRKDVNDLLGLLQFLHFEPYSQSARIWNRLIHEYRGAFKTLLGQIALRHTKSQVRDELRLPPQKRVVITVPFSAIEEQHYSQMFQQMCDECFVDQNGNPVTEDFDPESPVIVERMRTWLTRLRQTCLHPEVGNRNRRALGAGDGPLRTVAQVLETMIEQNEVYVRDEERSHILSQVRRGQMLENANRSQDALALWTKALQQSEMLVEDCRTLLDIELKKGFEEDQIEQTSSNSGPHAERPEKPRGRDSEGENGAEDAEVNSRAGTLRNRLRSALQVQHVCKFFIGNAYFQIKMDKEATAPDSHEFHNLEHQETVAYEEAKAIRKEMLTEIQAKVRRNMDSINKKAIESSFVKIPDMKPPWRLGGIENRRLLEKLNAFCNCLNEQAAQLEEWRETMVQSLRQSLIDEDENMELEGDEYEKSTKLQDEIYAYMEGLRAMFADRYDAFNGTKNNLIDHEMKFALRKAKEKEGVAPELFISLMHKRERLRLRPELGSLRGIIAEIRALIPPLQWAEGRENLRAHGELAIVHEILKAVQQISTEQLKVVNTLEKEVELFRETMNSRLEYYRQFQQISDTVAPFEEENVGKELDDARWQVMLEQERRYSEKISTLRAKRRYLVHLRTESSLDDEQRNCVICQSPFETGVLTVCGHQYCKDCLRQWWSEHRSCPVCKRHLQRNDFHEVTYKPQELAVHEESHSSHDDTEDLTSPTKTRGIYANISDSVLNQIKNVDLEGSFGTKIDTIARHILWLRDQDLGAKAIIFSQFREFLDVLGRAFRQFQIGHSSFDGKGGTERFKNDPSVEVFLLHAKAHSSGLNLVNATHVILAEPLINTALELQAIARVHRIGQHRPTTVWMYLVSDTVEEVIYDISVERRLAHVQSRRKGKGKERASESASVSESGAATPAAMEIETAIDAANSAALQEVRLDRLLTTGRSGGEVVGKEDLWNCLFGRMRAKSRPSATTLTAEGDIGVVGRFLAGEAAAERQRAHGC